MFCVNIPSKKVLVLFDYIPELIFNGCYYSIYLVC